MTAHEQKAHECAEEIHQSDDRIDVPSGLFVDSASKIILRHFPEPVEKTCRWTPIAKSGGMAKPECADVFMDCNKDEMGCYCPYCGGKII